MFYEDSFFGFDPYFSTFNAVFFIIFGFVAVVIIASIIRGIARWGKNNASPILTVTAEIVNMRQELNHHSHGDSHASSSTTDYFVTFQVESGDRMELRVSGREYGLLAQGDVGRLTFQGTRYKGFDRY